MHPHAAHFSADRTDCSCDIQHFIFPFLNAFLKWVVSSSELEEWYIISVIKKIEYELKLTRFLKTYLKMGSKNTPYYKTLKRQLINIPKILTGIICD